MAQKYTIQFEGVFDVSNILASVKNLQNSLNGLTLPKGLGTSISDILTNLSKEIEKFGSYSGKKVGTKGEFSNFTKSGEKILELYTQLEAKVKSLGVLSDKEIKKLFPDKTINSINNANAALKEYEKSANKVAKQENDINKLQDQQNKLLKLKGQLERGEKKTIGLDEYNQIKESAAAAKQKVDDLKNAQAELNKKQEELRSKLSKPQQSSTYRDNEKELKRLGEELNTAEAELAKFNAQKKQMTTADVNVLTAQIGELAQKISEAQIALNAMKGDSSSIDALFTRLGEAGIQTDGFARTAEGARAAVDAFAQQGIEGIRQKLGLYIKSTEDATRSSDNFRQQIDANTSSFSAFDDRMRDVEALKHRITYFFGLNNAINLARRALRKTYETIKELDKAMTETAVVTDFTVGDMWEQLPRYTKAANDLGTTTLGAYETLTLFYQQGLDTNEAFEIGTETMKMARIAGLEYADCADLMTAALRGFNMELNETSATRVNDVYSELAAITASNTEEIATAMTKTASIAHSANMEFETTAAFLAQMIETTRESAETSGTALKTVIARFTEVKELFTQGQLTGEDSEGEEININKIDTALKTVGLSLKDFLNGQKGLDDILLELASKWDGLDLATQRYIATMAAGSRRSEMLSTATAA